VVGRLPLGRPASTDTEVTHSTLTVQPRRGPRARRGLAPRGAGMGAGPELASRRVPFRSTLRAGRGGRLALAIL